MKNLFVFMAMFLLTTDVFAVTQAVGRGRVSMTNQIMAAPRATVASKNSMNAMAATNTGSVQAAMAVTPEQAVPAVRDVDRREKEKKVCLANNIGVGNTFVWASRYSNTQNYANMVEDIKEPENNVCFVKVGLKSNDARIDLSDIRMPYFEMGREIVCGSWADEGLIEQRILDAKKSARVWGTVGGAVGGAGLGVGAMELFGNKLIGGAVEGQRDMTESEFIRSQILSLKKDNSSQYNQVINLLKSLKAECVKSSLSQGDKEKCSKFSSVFDLAI